MSAFAIERRGNVAIVTFNVPNEPVNTISKAVGWELDEVLSRLACRRADQGDRAPIGEARFVHCRRRHRGVRAASLG